VPIYTELAGWGEDISDSRDFDDLPVEARRYIGFIEEHVGVPVNWVSVGPERGQVVTRI
jgi:adenylosuccinate synthase